MISIIRYCFNEITKAPTRILIIESDFWEKKAKRVGGIPKCILPVNDNQSQNKELKIFASIRKLNCSHYKFSKWAIDKLANWQILTIKTSHSRCESTTLIAFEFIRTGWLVSKLNTVAYGHSPVLFIYT